jgi:biopolymer transport protein ExbD
MKIAVAKKIHYDAGPNMTPLVDITMVILIFLMMAGSFGGGEHYLQSNILPKAKGAGGAPPPPGWVPDVPLEIRVDSRGGAFEAAAGRIKVADVQALTSQLKLMLRQFESAGTKPDKIEVKISPGRNTKYEHLVKVYESAVDAGFSKVGFTTAHDLTPAP